MKNGLKTLATWLILSTIIIVLISSILDNSSSKMTYSDLVVAIR